MEHEKLPGPGEATAKQKLELESLQETLREKDRTIAELQEKVINTENKLRELEAQASPSSSLKATNAKTRTILMILATFIATILMALAASEWLCRVFFRKNIEEIKFTNSDQYYYYDRAGYRHHTPNAVGYERMWNDQGKAQFRINSLGFRGPEIGAKKPGTFRVLFLGDSITLGGRLPEDETFVGRIAKTLGASRSARYEVMNAGVGDVGLIEEEETLKTSGIQAQPDLVVLCWYLNDARPPVGFPEEIVYNNRFIKWFNEHPFIQKSYLAGFVYDTIRRSLVDRELVKTRRHQWMQPYVGFKWTADANEFSKLIKLAQFDWGDAWNDDSLEWTTSKIKALRDFTAARGIRFVMVEMPLHAQIYTKLRSKTIDKPQDVLTTFARKNDIPALNLLPSLRALAGTHANDPLYYDNCHYTPRGNEILAKEILKFLEKSKVLQTE